MSNYEKDHKEILEKFKANSSNGTEEVVVIWHNYKTTDFDDNKYTISKWATLANGIKLERINDNEFIDRGTNITYTRN